MITKAFTAAWRNILRNKVHAMLNLAGLALGITCCIIIFLIVRYELSFDNFHAKKDRIFRVTTAFLGDETNYLGAAPYPMGEAILHDFAEVETTTTVSFLNEALVKVGHDLFQETGISYVSPSFFDLFDFQWVISTPIALEKPYSVVLTESLAKKFFGEDGVSAQTALGKIIKINDQTEFQVTGIIKDFPENTDFPFTMLLSYATIKSAGNVDMESWINVSAGVNHYVLLKEGAEVGKVEAMLPAFLEKYYPAEEVIQRAHQFQPLNQVHFDERFGNYNQRTPTKASILSLGVVGIFLLLTACINFVNLATAQSITRSKEVGVRKVLGASRGQLLRQFMIETLVLTLIAMIVAIILTDLIFPYIQGVLALTLRIDWLSNPILLLFIGVLTLFVSFLAGFYPAIILSGFKPILALKSKLKNKKSNGLTLRRGLIVFQFLISQVLIISTLIVAEQLEYFNNQPLGFAKEAIITVNIPEGDAVRAQTFANEIRRTGGIQTVSLAMNIPTNQGGWFGAYNFQGSGSTADMPVEMKPIDPEYLETFELKLLAGRDIIETDSLFGSVIVNETIMRRMGLTDPHDAIGERISVFGTEVNIAGVVKDFHSQPLQEGINPVILFNSPNRARIAALKFATKDIDGILSSVGILFKEKYPERVFNYQFIDETIAAYYQEEEKLSKLFTIFSSIAIFIGCLGLYGLISFVAVQKTKEIGVRKVLGASVGNIIFLFVREFISLILIAFVIAAPFAWYIMNKWLQGFEFRIDIGPQIFLLAVGFTIVIATISISFRSIRAALANPIQSLGSE